MIRFDENYEVLSEMRGDTYYPSFLVNKLEDEIRDFIFKLEENNFKKDDIQSSLDNMVGNINIIADEFLENNSEIETVARDSIAVTVEYILDCFKIDIDIEEALRDREW